MGMLAGSDVTEVSVTAKNYYTTMLT